MDSNEPDGSHEPDASTVRGLRLAVHALRVAHAGRRFTPTLVVGALPHAPVEGAGPNPFDPAGRQYAPAAERRDVVDRWEGAVPIESADPPAGADRSGAACLAFEVDRDMGGDAGLRLDVAAALLERVSALVPRPAVLLARPGPWDACLLDLPWLSAARAAAQASGVQPSATVVLTPQGWRDPFSGAERQWRRLRLRKHWYPPGHPRRQD